MTGVRFSTGVRLFSLRHRVQTDSGAKRASYTMGTGSTFPGGEVDHSPPFRAKVKNAWGYTSTPPYVFTTWCLVTHRNKFTLPFTLNEEQLAWKQMVVTIYKKETFMAKMLHIAYVSWKILRGSRLNVIAVEAYIRKHSFNKAYIKEFLLASTHTATISLQRRDGCQQTRRLHICWSVGMSNSYCDA
jgi:hypothetical protein